MKTTIKNIKEVLATQSIVCTATEQDLILGAVADATNITKENLNAAIIFFGKDLLSKRAPTGNQPVQEQQVQEQPVQEQPVQEEVKSEPTKDEKIPVLDRPFKERVRLLDTFLSQQSIDFRVGVGKADGQGFSLLGYKDARVDMDMLDAIIGKGNWQPKYHRDIYPNSKGGSSSTLICSLGLYNDELKEWVWKESNGTESNTEQEKGQYSDAFKRAGFMWGIGRKLYDLPFMWITKIPKDVKNGKLVVRPNDWIWDVKNDGKKYTYIQAKEKDGTVRYTYGRP